MSQSVFSPEGDLDCIYQEVLASGGAIAFPAVPVSYLTPDERQIDPATVTQIDSIYMGASHLHLGNSTDVVLVIGLRAPGKSSIKRWLKVMPGGGHNFDDENQFGRRFPAGTTIYVGFEAAAPSDGRLWMYWM